MKLELEKKILENNNLMTNIAIKDRKINELDKNLKDLQNKRMKKKRRVVEKPPL